MTSDQALRARVEDCGNCGGGMANRANRTILSFAAACRMGVKKLRKTSSQKNQNAGSRCPLHSTR